MNPAESYILNQPPFFREILLQLQVVIESEIPEVELKYKYRIPFYYLKDKPFCYMNQSGDYVDLGFAQSAYLTRHLDKMYSKGRKVVRSLRYRSIEELDYEVLLEVLEEASSHAGKSFFKNRES